MLRLRLSLVTSILFFTISAYAAITGAVSGTITDATGAVLPGVSLTVVNQDTGVQKIVVSDGKGFYSFPALDVGTYTITATDAGFEAYQVKDILIDANSSLRTDITLRVGSATAQVEVASNPVQVETQSTQLGEVISADKITAVPLNGRSFTDLLALQPGVSPYSGTTEIASGGGKTVSGSLNSGNVSINGGREAANGFMVNGADVNDGVQNGTAIVPNLDAISEFRIITNNFDAEYGNFAGGQVNVVTKNGTNQFHGSGFEFFRDTALNARGYNFTPVAKSPYRQNIYGGTFGGPIRRDKIFFFGDYQGTKQSIGAAELFQVPSTADLSGNLLDAAGSMSGFTVNGTGWASALSKRLGYPVTAGEPYYKVGCTAATCVFPGAIVPKTAWDPVATGMLKYIQPANTTFNGLPYYSNSSLANTLTDNKEGIRVDVNTHLGTIFGYYFLDNYKTIAPYGGGYERWFPDRANWPRAIGKPRSDHDLQK